MAQVESAVADALAAANSRPRVLNGGLVTTKGEPMMTNPELSKSQQAIRKVDEKETDELRDIEAMVTQAMVSRVLQLRGKPSLTSDDMHIRAQMLQWVMSIKG